MKLMLIFFITSLFFNPPKASVEKWIIEKSSNLSIEGRSNVSSFQCDVTEYLRADTVFFYKDDQQIFTTKGGLTINVNGFDCHQRYLTNDLRKTLKAAEFPLLKIDLLSLGNFTAGDGNQKVKGWVAVQLAHITRKIEVDYTVKTGNGGILHLYGSQQLLFSDFGLVPPQKLAGLIKVEQQINIRFQLILRPI